MISWNETLHKLLHKRSVILIFIGFFSLFQNACNSLNPEETIPAYLYIPSIKLQVAGDGSQGSRSNDILDAWVFADGELVGVFELPALVPVLKNGAVEISISAGIKRNGISNDRAFYPFYSPYIQDLELFPGKTDTINAVIGYRSNVKFVWIEDFEDGSNSFTRYDAFATIDSMFISEEPDDVFQFEDEPNRRCAKVLMDTGRQFFHNATANQFDLPRGGNEIYLEANYKCDFPLQFGIIPTVNTIFGDIPIFLAFGTGGEWKKVYISLKEDVNTPEFRGDAFKVFIAAISNSKDSVPEILIDNLKILHFE